LFAWPLRAIKPGIHGVLAYWIPGFILYWIERAVLRAPGHVICCSPDAVPGIASSSVAGLGPWTS